MAAPFKHMLYAVLLLGTLGTMTAADPFHTDDMQPEFRKDTTGGKAPVTPRIGDSFRRCAGHCRSAVRQ